MAPSTEIISIDNQLIPPLLQTEKDEIEEGRKVDHIIDLNDLDNLYIKSWTISKVNVWLRESNPDAYTPKMVSIGPYHKKNPQLDSMEKYKKLYLRRFLQRKEGLDVKSCISEMVKLKKEALECYDDMKDIDTKMLLLDGCFVVEFIREHSREHSPKGEDKIININNNYIRPRGHVFNLWKSGMRGKAMYNKPLRSVPSPNPAHSGSFSASGCSFYISRDLLLLENQLPFFVLDQLFLMTKQDDDEPLEKLVSHWFHSFVHFPITTECKAGNIKHLLHLLHIFSCHGITKEKSNDYKTMEMVMPNATELSEAGVSFAKVSNMTSSFDIKFENGLMTIPCFRVEDDTETILRNLIAYEQQSSDEHSTYFSDYATFMDHLIDSDKDVNLLRKKGIIVNWLGEDKEVASLFNKIGKGVTLYHDGFYYNKQFRKAVEHCKKPWNRMKANLKHNYFSSPWVGASTVAAIILLILTTIQTILAFTGSVM
ncbi:putative UPF0481 protein At3g02645 [Solanum dulcamara]|uniref:putative UPF0481 protein At3g02645 n=1 Tax=Solanum dulcamara TaxID=45834 RepID=UPI0024868B88|nr:putative UPF0481 protein At3g02645 [Solanum dulcamara]